jgi:hypothetical protein
MVVSNFDHRVRAYWFPRSRGFRVPVRIVARLAAGEWCGLTRAQFSNGGFRRAGDINGTHIVEPAGDVIQPEQKLVVGAAD